MAADHPAIAAPRSLRRWTTCAVISATLLGDIRPTEERGPVARPVVTPADAATLDGRSGGWPMRSPRRQLTRPVIGL